MGLTAILLLASIAAAAPITGKPCIEDDELIGKLSAYNFSYDNTSGHTCWAFRAGLAAAVKNSAKQKSDAGLQEEADDLYGLAGWILALENN